MPPKSLDVPRVASRQFQRNFIKSASCDLRFPILLELEQNPPFEIQRKLKKDYPHFDRVFDFSIQAKDAAWSREEPKIKNEKAHYQMWSKDRKWTITIKPESIVIGTSTYTNFQDFLARIEGVVSKCAPEIDSDFFTRVGLRYVNAIPFDNKAFTGYINPVLASPIESGVLGTIAQYANVVSGYLADGNYIFRHGISKPNQDPDADPEYFLDFDYFKEMVSLADLSKLLTHFHDYNFSFFHWCLGPKAIKLLGPELQVKG